MEEFVIILIVAAVAVILFSCLRIVPQAHEFVIEFLGKYRTTWSAGLHLKIPFLEKISKKVTLKEQVLDSPPQPVITKDNVTMQIDTVVFYRIFDAKMYTYGVVNPVNALSNLTATTLRNIIGEMDLDSTLTSRDTINGKLTGILDEATDQWGIKITRVELKNIIPPAAIQAAMEKQMKAERDRRETLLQAEGHKEASITRAEGDKRAMVLAAEGERDARIARAEGEAQAIYLAKKAEADGLRALMEAGIDATVLELKKYEALTNVANGRAAKLIIPSDVVDTVKKNVIFSETSGLGDQTVAACDPAPEAKPDPCCDK
ncbi:MAG: SPFH/Band 7/PHB domain protein [Clostridia bacterium]|nr:SPFH/Band 7/PHB domain protein [Clostridia bacterium]